MNTHYGTWDCFWDNRKRLDKQAKKHRIKRKKIANASRKRNRK